MTLAGGAIFGLAQGTVWCPFASTLGALLPFAGPHTVAAICAAQLQRPAGRRSRRACAVMGALLLSLGWCRVSVLFLIIGDGV